MSCFIGVRISSGSQLHNNHSKTPNIRSKRIFLIINPLRGPINNQNTIRNTNLHVYRSSNPCITFCQYIIKLFANAKVAHFNHSLLVKENIIRLYISMDLTSAIMNVVQTHQYLMRDLGYYSLWYVIFFKIFFHPLFKFVYQSTKCTSIHVFQSNIYFSL